MKRCPKGSRRVKGVCKKMSPKKSPKRRSPKRRSQISEILEADLRMKSKSRKLTPFEQSELKDMQWLNSL